MKISFCLFLAAAAGLFGCATTDAPSMSSQAAPAAQTTEAATTEVVDSPARMTSATTASTSAHSGSDLVCKDIATIGTRFTKRICKTKAQIAEEKEAGKAMLDPSKTLMSPPAPR